MTSTDKTADLLRAVLADLAPVVGAITAEQLHDAIPCTEFDVEQLRHHVLGWLTTFAAGFTDAHGQAPRANIDGYETPADASAEVHAAADQLVDAVRGGAAGRPLQLGDSAMPGDLALGMILWEYQVHGWDLAQATGQLWLPPAEATEESLRFAPAMRTDDYQGDGRVFANPVDVPADAGPWTACSGSPVVIPTGAAPGGDRFPPTEGLAVSAPSSQPGFSLRRPSRTCVSVIVVGVLAGAMPRHRGRDFGGCPAHPLNQGDVTLAEPSPPRSWNPSQTASRIVHSAEDFSGGCRVGRHCRCRILEWVHGDGGGVAAQ